MDGMDFYFWGFINGPVSFSYMEANFPSNIPFLLLWLLILSVGVILIMASIRGSIPSNSFILYIITVIILTSFLIYYGYWIIITIYQSSGELSKTIGLGYYLIMLILFLDFISLISIKKELIF